MAERQSIWVSASKSPNICKTFNQIIWMYQYFDDDDNDDCNDHVDDVGGEGGDDDKRV